jgi:hypothetical protein
MARKGRPKTSARIDVTVRLDRTIADKARQVAYARGIPIAEYLSEMLRGPIDRAYAQFVREIEKPQGESQ